MDEKPRPLWDEMLDEFRVLGGTADNVCLGEGKFGRGLFPIDPSKPIKVHIPESLLVAREHVEFVNDAFRIKPEAPIGAREKSFLENYERDFSWSVSRRYTHDLLQMMDETPAELREHLSKFCKRWMAGPTPEAVQERFLSSRVVRYKGQSVIMPIVELANHGDATEYVHKNGVGLSGQFADEISVRYCLSDPWRIFANWGFPSASETFALSMGMNNPQIAIGEDDVSDSDMDPAKPFFPKVSREGTQLRLSYLMLGNRRWPRLPRGIFHRIMKDAGRLKADEIFDIILHRNRTEFYKLLEATEMAAPPLGRLLRTVITQQLKAM